MDKQLLKQAREALGKGDSQGALAALESLLKDDPANYNGLVFKGKAHADLGETDNAVKAYRQAIAATPSQPLAWTGLSQLSAKSGDLATQAEALAALRSIYSDLYCHAPSPFPPPHMFMLSPKFLE